MSALFTAEGREIHEAVQAEAGRRADKAEQLARSEAQKRGSDEEAAARQARSASFEESRKTRKKSFETAQAVFAKTGSTEQAIVAATKVGAVKGPKKKKGAKGKKEKDDSLAHDIEKQLDENAKKMAQMRAARALREKRVGPEGLKAFEEAEYDKIREASGARYRETGELPAGIAQDVRQISRVPNEADLAGRVAPPVISIQNNKYEITGNDFMVTVEGQFATTGQEVGRMALHEFRRGLNLLLGEATPTPEKR
jgi:vacuolar-type H+-ATPase subunit E/Vma4